MSFLKFFVLRLLSCVARQLLAITMQFCSVTEGGIMELRRTMWAGGEGCLSEAGSKLCRFTVNNTGLYFKKSYTCDKSEVILYSSDCRRDKSKESCHCAVFKTEDYLANSQLSNSFFCLPVVLSFSSSPLTAVIPSIQWTRITVMAQITFPTSLLMERGQRSLSTRWISHKSIKFNDK